MTIVSAARICSDNCQCCTDLLRQLSVLHGSAQTIVSAARICSDNCQCCTDLPRQLSVLHVSAQTIVSAVRICPDNCQCCTDLPRQLLVLPRRHRSCRSNISFLTQSQYTDTGTTSPIPDPITPGVRQGCHWRANFEVLGITPSGKLLTGKAGFERKSAALGADALPLSYRGGAHLTKR